MNREDYPKLQAHARIGNVIFAPGVSERTVVEYAMAAGRANMEGYRWLKSFYSQGSRH